MTFEPPPLDQDFEYPDVAPVEHIAGNEKFARKAFELQAAHVVTRNGRTRSRVDVTLDLEDGAPVGHEEELRTLFLELLAAPENRFGQVGVRVHAPGSPHLERDLKVLSVERARSLAHITLPKVRTPRDVLWAAGVFEALAGRPAPPFHVLIETPDAVAAVRNIAALPQVRVLDFGLLDFISHLGGAIPDTCMRSPGQFDHPLLRRTRIEIAMAALSSGKVAGQNVTIDVRDPEQAFNDALRARTEFGCSRMWSIHPLQIEPILRGMSPAAADVETARAIIAAASAAKWGPIEYGGKLQDRASYRYYWGVLRRAGVE